jgi:hypothetical protein
MTNYKIVQNKRSYTVVETATNHNIKTFSLARDAKAFMRHLNLGGGFDSWTPQFFLVSLKKTG